MLARFGVLLLVCLSVFMSACSSNKPVKTYEGDLLPEASVAILTAPENIKLLSVNSKAVTQYLLSNLEVNYALREGENLIVFQYESIWGKARKDEETGSRAELVQSKPLEVLIDAKAGMHYSFSFVPANDVREAKTLAASFVAQVVDAQNNLVAESVPQGAHKQAADERLAKEQTILTKKSDVTEQAKDTESVSVIDKLKVLWAQASPEQKKAFMVWVFQE